MSLPLTDAEIDQVRQWLAQIRMGFNPFDGQPWWMALGRSGFGSIFQGCLPPAGHVYTEDDTHLLEDALGLPRNCLGSEATPGNDLRGTTSKGPANITIDVSDRRGVYMELGDPRLVGADITAIEIFLSVAHAFKNTGVKILAQGGSINPVLELRGDGIEVDGAVPRFLIGWEDPSSGAWTTRDLFKYQPE